MLLAHLAPALALLLVSAPAAGADFTQQDSPLRGQGECLLLGLQRGVRLSFFAVYCAPTQGAATQCQSGQRPTPSMSVLRCTVRECVRGNLHVRVPGPPAGRG